MTPDALALNFRNAAARIQKSKRSVQRLVKKGTLKTIGAGQSKRVLISSIKGYLERNCDKTGDKTLPVSPVVTYQQRVQRLMRKLPPLNSPNDAARRLGITTREVQRLVNDKSIPSIPIGQKQFIPAFWLASILAQASGLEAGGLPEGR